MQFSTTLPMHFAHNLFYATPISLATKKKLLAKTGIAFSLVDEPNSRVTVSQFAALYRLLAIELDDETPSFFSRPLRNGTLKYLCLSLLDAPNLQVALHRYCQFFHILLDDANYQLELGSDTACISFNQLAPLKGHKVLVNELMLKLVHGVASWLIGSKLLPVKISFAFAQPKHSHEYLYFYPGKVDFNQSRTALYLTLEDLKKPLVQTKQGLSGFLKQAPADWIYVSFGERLISHQVKDYLATCEQPKDTISQVAQALHFSSRSLSRYLAQEGTSFQTIKDEVRRDLAITALTSKKTSVTEIAENLGFEDLSSFNRAFKKWTGNTPRSYRFNS